ncbi:LysR substrate-binding domain-containing protein [Alkalicoccobacillus plakortidis]|uniref:LysR substrate-binding domain-containing protein n=1 Tax=Alkalicoccobacillus plakortidis TaxID=444060 RepID=A0ABT0XQP6_9BACI|nr:LysR substrate-binding domain-containing protein [Alkalicoccobacillus plakortidis]MCM2677607.1 LysR substrate-binding domain-containing protein [Alkalicoccobacillus plakortidis]
MHMDELETFITLVQEKNFTKTAVKRSLSQPTVSVHIRNLEKEFSATFFKRTTKQLSLTAEGAFFYEQALQIKALYQHTQETLYQKKKQAAGLIRIGTSFTIGEYILPQIIANLRADHPLIEISITMGNTQSVIDAVRSFEADIGFVEGQTSSKEVILTPFKEDRLRVVRSGKINASQIQSIDDLHDQTWVIREPGSGTRHSFDHLIKTNHIRLGSTIVFSSTHGIKESVKNNLGLALLSETTMHEELQAKIFASHRFRRPFSETILFLRANKRNCAWAEY